MGTTPPPVPIKGVRLTITETMLRSTLKMGGVTGKLSDDLTAVCSALRVLEIEFPQKKIHAEALSRAWAKWLGGNHPGELSILQSGAEFRGISDFVARFPVPLPQGPRPLPGTPGSTLESFALALFTVNNKVGHFKLSVPERLHQLSWAVDHFNNWILAQNQASLQTDNAFVGILIAPEYYWTLADPGGERHFLDLQAKNQIEHDLKILSKAYPKILIVPGTIHYDVQMDAKGKVEAGYQLLKAAKDRILRERMLANPKLVLDASNRDPNVLNSNIPSMNILADNLLDKNTTPRKVHNLTYLLLDGKIWSQYDKQTDYFESKSISPDRSMFIPGTENECPEIGNATRKFRFGVEICYDHCQGVLKRRQPANLHFHIVVSDWVGTQTAHMAMTNNGYFLHASTNYDETVVYHKLANGQVDDETLTKNLHNVPMASGFLDFYLLQLPNA